MYHPTMFSYSETTAKNIQATSPATAPLSSQSPFRFYSPDIPGSRSISSTRSSPEIPSHTISGYNFPHRNDGQLPWTLSMARDPYDAHLDLTLAPTPYIGDPQTRLDQRFPRIRNFEIVFTDDARRKLGEGVHRWCFNCRSTETTTWRRSSLSPGKLLCNRCGLFERTHHIPRPEKFPRRRRARPASAFPIPAFSGERWQCQNHLSSTVPLTQSFQPFDSVGGQSIPQTMSWTTRNEVGPSPSPTTCGQCSPTSLWHQQAMYCGDSQTQSVVLADSACATSSSW